MRKPATGMQTFRVARAHMIMTSVPLVHLKPASLAIRAARDTRTLFACVYGWLDRAWDLYSVSPVTHTYEILMIRRTNRWHVNFDLSLFLQERTLLHNLGSCRSAQLFVRYKNKSQWIACIYAGCRFNVMLLCWMCFFAILLMAPRITNTPLSGSFGVCVAPSLLHLRYIISVIMVKSRL